MLAVLRGRISAKTTYLPLIQIRPQSNLSYIHNNTGEKLHYTTLGKLLETAANKYGDRPAIISRHQKQTLTFHETLVQADRLASGLRKIGLKQGDRVGIWAPNTVEWYVTHMACARAGFVLVNLNPAYLSKEIQFCIKSAEIKAIVCAHKFKTQNYYEHLLQVAPDIYHSEPGRIKSKTLPSLESIVVFDAADHLRGTFTYEEVINLATAADMEKVRLQQDQIDPDSVCHFQFTSGTTGTPKIPMQSHFIMINSSYLQNLRNELGEKHHTLLCPIPFFHVFGSVGAIGSSLNFGCTLVLPSPTFNADKSIDALRDNRCTVIYGTPTMYVDIINRQKARQEDIFCPEIVVTGAAICSPHLLKEIKSVLKVRAVRNMYGMTETAGASFSSMPGDDEHLTTSTVGALGSHLEAKVIDKDGKVVPRGTPGELCIRGYSTTLGYWNNEESNRQLMGPDKWLKTGDEFIIEENGYGKIVGRQKEIIIRGGENIYPKDIEDHLNSHPHILEAQVIGLPHEALGEEVCVCVRLRSDVTITLDDVKAYCKGNMAHFKIPSRLEIMEDFPKTTSGKIQKFIMVKQLTELKRR